MIRKSIYDKINNQNGAALITVLVVFLTLVVIVTTATQAALGNFKRAKQSSETSSVLYVAEAGLNEYYEQLKVYFEANKENTKYDKTFADRFIATRNTEFGVIVDEKIHTSYGTIMNQEAKSIVSFEFKSSYKEGGLFELKSVGYVGNETRAVAVELYIDKESVGEGYKQDYLGALNPAGSNATPRPFPNAGITLSGPYLVNIPLYYNVGAIVKGPVITNAPITFNTYDMRFQDGYIITSSEVIAKNTRGFKNVKGIILKPSGKFVNEGEYLKWEPNVTYIKPDILFLPYTASGDYSKYFEYRNYPAQTQAFTDYVLNNGKVYIYNPNNFDPYNDEVTEYKTNTKVKASSIMHNGKSFFGNNPDNDSSIKYDIRDYFENDFILDKLENNEITLDEYLPSVELPHAPEFDYDYKSAMYPFNISASTPNDINLILGNSVKSVDLVAETELGNYKRWYRNFKVDGNTWGEDFKIYIGNKDIVLYVENFSLKGNLQIIGSGTLKIYVVGNNYKNTASTFNFDVCHLDLRDESGKLTFEPERVHFYVYETVGSNLLTAKVNGHSSSLNFIATIFSDNLNLNVSTQFNGNFVSAKGESVFIKDTGQTLTSKSKSQIIYIPNGTFEIEGGTFKGVVSAENFVFGSNGQIIYESDFDKSLEDILSEVVIPTGTGEGSGSKGKESWGPIKEVNE